MALTKVTQHSLGNSAVTTAKINLSTPLGIANSTSNTLYLQSNGRIGVGTTDLDSFGRKFLVSGTGGFDNASGTVGIGFSRGASNTYGYLGTGDWAVNGLSNTDFGISSGPTGALALGVAAGNEKMRIAANGNIGIATTTPAAKLDVSGTFRQKAYTIGGVGAPNHSTRFVIDLADGSPASTTQALFHADDNAAFKITYYAHGYDNGAGNSNMMRVVEYYGAVGSGGAGQSGEDYYFVTGNAYGTLNSSFSPSFSISNQYVAVTFGNSSYASSRVLVIEWQGNAPPSFHPSLTAPT